MAYHELCNPPKQRDDIKAAAFIGPSGCGKSREAAEIARAFEGHGEAFWKGDGDWTDGYLGQKLMIIDEFHPGEMRLANILRLTDRYPFRFQRKGGFNSIQATRVLFTSNYELELWIPDITARLVALPALERRITVWKFPVEPANQVAYELWKDEFTE